MLRSAKTADLGLDWIEIAGHSIAAGGGARIAPQGGYALRLMGALDIANVHDYSIGGAIACRPTTVGTGDGGYPWVLRNVIRPGSPGVTAAAGAPYIPQSQLVLPHFGLNDLGELGANKPLPFQTSLRTILARFCAASVFESDPLGGSAPQWAYTGTWSEIGNLDANANSSGGGVRFTTAVGDKATFTTPADFPANRVVGIGLWIGGNWVAPAVIGVKIDGTDFPDVTLDASTMTDQLTTTYHNVHTLRIGTGIPGDPYGAALGAGAHTVELTLKSGPMLVTDFAHVEADPADGPLLACPLPHKPATYGIWTSWPGFPTLGDSAVDAWKDYERAVLAEFPGRVISDSQGLGIDLDQAGLTRYTLSPGTALAPAGVIADHAADGAHPVESGHGKLAQYVARAIRQSPLITDRVRTRSFVDPRTRGWKKVGQVNGGGTFATGWSNFNAAGLYEAQWRMDRNRRVFVRGAVKGATGVTTALFVNGSLPKPAAVVSKYGAQYDGTNWSWRTLRVSNLGGATYLGAAVPTTLAGNFSEFDVDYQAEL